MSEIPADLRAGIRNRSMGWCEVCGKARATQQHHRQYLSRGGQNVPENLLDVCGSGNHSGCHGKAHSGDGEALGLSVRSGFNPAGVPVYREQHLAWFRLTANGWEQVTVLEAAAMWAAVYGVPTTDYNYEESKS